MVVAIKYLAHAGFQITAKDKVIYLDLESHAKVSEKADLILVTHSHLDHCDPSKINEACKADTVIIAPADCAPKIGKKVKTLKPGEETKVNGITVKAVEAYNYKRFRSPGNPYHPKDFGVGYVITVDDKTVYHAGDTDFIPEMRHLGHVDVALVPSGDTYTMDNAEAALAAAAINPKAVIPIHRWKTNPEEFKEKVDADSNVKVLILQEGEEYKIP
jgi:L-ascorbate metabolism protein UlaG (beta-lactamase superfamily)